MRRFQTSKRARLPEGDLCVVLADQTRALRDQQELAGRAVVHILGDLGGHLARQVGTQAGDQRCWDNGAGLQHVGARGGHNAIGADGASIDIAVQEGELVILGRQIGGAARRPASVSRLSTTDGCRAFANPTLVVANRRLVRAASCSCARRCCSGSSDAVGAGMPGAGAPALKIGRPRSPGKRRPELRGGFRQAGIVLRQIGQAVGRVTVIGVVKFGACGLVLRFQRQKQRAADPEGRGRAKAEENLCGTNA